MEKEEGERSYSLLLLFSGVLVGHHLSYRRLEQVMFYSASLGHVLGVTFSNTVPGLNSNDGARAQVAMLVDLELQGLAGRPPDRKTGYWLQKGKNPTPYKLLKKILVQVLQGDLVKITGPSICNCQPF